VLDLYTQRATQLLGSQEAVGPEQITDIAHRALELTFEKEGLELAEFLSGTRDENMYVAIADQIDEAINESKLVGTAGVVAKEVAMGVLRQAFYNSSEEERIYYGKLSRTYALLFTLRNEPRVVEYFKGMSSDFVLFIGTDLVVRALSERYLAKEYAGTSLRRLRSRRPRRHRSDESAICWQGGARH
jgi:hypothetical protein